MLAKRKCPLCENASVELIHSLNYIGNKNINGLPELVDIVMCKKCSLVYSDMISSQEQFNNYYLNNSSYSQDYGYLGAELYKTYYENILKLLKKYINKKHYILDLGCGNGKLLECLYEYGYKNIFGIDESSSFCNNKYNIDFIKGNIFLNDNIFNKKIDVITVVSVLEHIFDVKKLMQNIYYSLNNNGILYIDVPYIKSYNNRLNLSIEHINHFSKTAIINLAKKYKYKILEIKLENYIDGDHIQAVFCKTNKNMEYLDFDIIKKYNKFIEKINKDINFELINNFSKFQNKIILWGIAGSILPILPHLEKLNIISIVDSSPKKQGKTLLGHKIISPSEIKDEEATILILPELYYDNIYKQIKEIGLKNKIEFLTDRTGQDRTGQDRTPAMFKYAYLKSA